MVYHCALFYKILLHLPLHNYLQVVWWSCHQKKYWAQANCLDTNSQWLTNKLDSFYAIKMCLWNRNGPVSVDYWDDLLTKISLSFDIPYPRALPKIANNLHKDTRLVKASFKDSVRKLFIHGKDLASYVQLSTNCVLDSFITFKNMI